MGKVAENNLWKIVFSTFEIASECAVLTFLLHPFSRRAVGLAMSSRNYNLSISNQIGVYALAAPPTSSRLVTSCFRCL